MLLRRVGNLLTIALWGSLIGQPLPVKSDRDACVHTSGSELHSVNGYRNQLDPCKVVGTPSEPPCPVSPDIIKFIHIPKAAGTSVEELGVTLNSTWGRFDLIKLYQNSGGRVKDRACHCIFWHRPPHCLPQYYSNDTVTFTIVRHPTKRFMAEFCWLHKLYGWRKTAGQLIKMMEDKIRELSAYKDINNRGRMMNCHLVPQVEYTAAADYVLKMEDIDRQFLCLGRVLFKQDTALPKANTSPSVCTGLGPYSLSPKALRLLEDFYDSDFKAFGYQKYSEAAGA